MGTIPKEPSNNNLPIIAPTATSKPPSPTAKPEVKSATSQRKSSDPIVNCQLSEECGGGTRTLKLSECNKTTCCQIGGSWYVYPTDECNNAQTAGSTSKNQGGSTGPVNRKKVTFTTTEATVDGAYQCYEDRVNELTRMENELKVMSASAETCSLFKQAEVNKCVGQCPINGSDWVAEWTVCKDTCFQKLDECLSKSKEVGDKRKEYMNLISQICP